MSSISPVPITLNLEQQKEQEPLGVFFLHRSSWMKILLYNDERILLHLLLASLSI